MVTFALPGDDVADQSSGTPRARPQLGFATRHLNNSPFASKRLGTPQGGSARKLLAPRDELPSASLNKGSIATARNIFRSSDISDSPPRTTPFSPALPQSTMKKVFRPSATPEVTRTFRDSSTTAQPAARGVAAKAAEKDLFEMRISEPPEHLTGSVLSKQVPADWSSKTSIYADQYLAHLCPPGFDDEQRRQFFCILDLRRLKYAADEIFAGKTWKLNIINFAKEFDKSRSLILLRYGLYEFQNVKPSKEIMKRWRRDHGLPEPEEENEAAPTITPMKTKSPKKRRATDDDEEPQVKRRATDKVEEPAAAPLPLPAPTSTPAASKNKRKASVSEDADAQRNKLQKTPSAAKSMFEKIANKASTTPADSPAKPSLFSSAASKPSNGGLARSIFENKANGSQGASNIFGHLSDTGSAKGSGVDADDESETSSDADDAGEGGQSDEQAAAGDEDMISAAKEPLKNGTETGFSSSAAGTRESTPGRSLFDRVTKGNDGQAVRAELNGDKPAGSFDQTWNPSTTPIKFGPPTTSTQSTSLFGASTTTPATAPASSLFAPKSASTSTNIFGAPKPDTPIEKHKEESKKDAESDKENESQPPAKKSAFTPQSSSEQPTFSGSSIFQQKPASTGNPKEAESAKPTASLFGTANNTPSSSNIFASNNQNGGTTTPAPVTSSTLFGAKNAESEKTSTPALFSAKPAETNNAATEPPKANIFGAAPTASTDVNTSGGLFSAKPAVTTTTASNIFGNSVAKPASSIFPSASEPAKTDAEPPKFLFGATSGALTNGSAPASTKPIFGAPKSPPASAPSNMFDGSPMKQDEASPAKKPTPAFSFGGAATTAPTSNLFGSTTTSSAPSSNIFGQSSTTNGNTAGSGNIFGGITAAPESTTPNSSFGGNSAAGGFGFSFGGTPATSGPGPTPASGTGFNNPFTSGNTGSTDNVGAGFSFGASSTASGDTTTPFQFGASSTTGSFQFGANQPSTNGTSSGAPTFSFSGAPSQPSQSSGGTTFGQNTSSNVFNLQPTAGASSGTNTPFTLGGSSLATTPARGTPEPSTAKAEDSKGGDDDEGEKHEQISLTSGAEEGEEQLHEVRAKVLKFIKDDGEEKKSKSPWSTQGVGPLRLLKNKETSMVRLLLRAEPRGHVALNRALMPSNTYKADEKYVKLLTSNEMGDGLETWMIQVKTKDLAKELAEALEKYKDANKS